MIYAIHILRLQYVKIGYSQHEDVNKRIAELQTGCPFEITPLLTVQGSLVEEKAMHSALAETFAQMHLPMPPNEWYPGRHPFFVKFLNEFKYGAQPAIALCEAKIRAGHSKGVRPGSPERHNVKPRLKWPGGFDSRAHREHEWAHIPDQSRKAATLELPQQIESITPRNNRRT